MRVIFAALLFFSVFQLHSQIVWQEDFSGYPDYRLQGDNKNTANPAPDWTAFNANDCDGGGSVSGINWVSSQDWFGIDNGEFRCNDVEGLTCCGSGTNRGGTTDNEFITELIDISAYCSVKMSLDAREVGDHESYSGGCNNSDDRIYTYYSLDSGPFILWQNNGDLSDNFSNRIVSQDGISGNTLQIRILIGNKANNENIYFDNIIVEAENSNLDLTLNIPSSDCANNNFTASVTGPDASGATFIWSNSGNITNDGGSSEDYSFGTSGSKTISVDVSKNGCTTTLSGNINIADNTAPTVANQNICAGESTTLNATASGGTYNWYDVPTGGTAIFTGNTFTTNALNSDTTFYVESTLSGCTSARTAVMVTVNQTTAPTVANQIICAGENATLNATAPGGTYNWYDVATGGTAIFTGNTFTTNALNSDTTFYVESTLSGCTSARTAVTISLHINSATLIITPSNVCEGESVTAEVINVSTGPSTIQYNNWAIESGGQNTSNDGGNSETFLINSTPNQISVDVVNGNGCNISLSATPNLISKSIVPVTNDIIQCIGTTPIGISPSGPNFFWLSGDSTFLGNTVPTYNTNTAFDTTFYVYQNNGNCNSDTASINIKVNPSNNTPSTNNLDFCINEASSQLLPNGSPFVWFDENDNELPNAPKPNTASENSTFFYVIDTTNQCNSLADTAFINVYPKPSNITPYTIEYCENKRLFS